MTFVRWGLGALFLGLATLAVTTDIETPWLGWLLGLGLLGAFLALLVALAWDGFGFSRKGD
jgi:hypothetical protein